MPKNKKDSSSDSSDSGPDDRNPPPSKRTKDDSKSEKSSSKVEKSKQSKETKWQLEKMRFVNINEFRGRKMVDIREFYEKNGDILPGKKGISLSATQWRKLLEIAEEVTAALED